MDWTPRRKSIFLSALLVLAATGALAYAAADTAGIVTPFIDGLDWAAERPLASDRLTLAVVVSTLDAGGTIARAAGAEVTLDAVSIFGSFEEDDERVPTVELAREITGHDGRILFALPAGDYSVFVFLADAVDGLLIPLDESERYSVTFAHDGKIYWRSMTHEELEAGVDGAVVRVDVVPPGSPEPQAPFDPPADALGAALAFYEVRDGTRGALVLSGDSLAPPSELGWRLPVAEYELVATLGGVSATTRFTNLCDTIVRIQWDDPPTSGVDCLLTT